MRNYRRSVARALFPNRVLPRAFLLVALALLLPLLFAHGEAAASPKVPVIITFHQPPGPNERALVEKAGGEVRHSFNIIAAIAADVPESSIDGLSHNPKVDRVEDDGVVTLLDEELNNSWGVKRIGAGMVHGSNMGAGIRVGVLDTGIDYNHPDLNANYAGGYDFVNGDADAMDDHYHGTLVAGVIGAEDNDDGVVGAAPQVWLYGLKVLDYRGIGYESDIIAALEWAVVNSIDVANMSFGASRASTAYGNAVTNAYNAGLVLVAAAGNSGNCNGNGDKVLYPARFAQVIAVAATTNSDGRPCWSSTGPAVELAAPGSGITSTDLGGGYRSVSGTSVASPHVAGTAALVLASGNLTDQDGDGDVDNVDLRLKLQSTAEDIGLSATWSGYGLVDAYAASDSGSSPSSPPPPDDTTAPASPTGLAITVPTSEGGTLNLDWANNAEADLAGYNVYRSTTSGSGYAKANASLVTSSSYNDSGLTDGTTYYYVVTAVDTSSNESGYSNEASGSPAAPAAVVIHVRSVDVKIKKKGSKFDALAAVTVVDASDTPVDGATVAGKWTLPDGSFKTVSETTNGKGIAGSSTGRVEASSEDTFEFEVTNVSRGGATYEPSGADSGSAAVP